MGLDLANAGEAVSRIDATAAKSAPAACSEASFACSEAGNLSSLIKSKLVSGHKQLAAEA
jgi:hypothetical protein